MDDLTGATLKQLFSLARERLGSQAASLKTRQELLAALDPQRHPPEPALQTGSDAAPLVVDNFFVARPSLQLNRSKSKESTK